MILRYWRGWTTPGNADAYERLLGEVILQSISDRKLDGYQEDYLLRRSLAEEIEFATITKFDSIEAVRVFAGEDYETAYVPPSAREVLKRFDDRSAHYEVLRSPEELGDGDADERIRFACASGSAAADTAGAMRSAFAGWMELAPTRERQRSAFRNSGGSSPTPRPGRRSRTTGCRATRSARPPEDDDAAGY